MLPQKAPVRAARRCYHRPMALTLTEVRRMPEERRLRLTWTDGHVAEYDYDYLRGWCPCAGCQGHSGFKIRYLPPARPVTAESIKPVGNYAISIGFSDGHGTGIYRYEFLREICPCGGHGDTLPAELDG